MSWMVLGAGRSGLAAGKLLAAKKQKVVIAEQGKVPTATKDELINLGITVRDLDKGNAFSQIPTSGLVISPGIHSQHPYIAQANRQGIRTLSEVDLALSYYGGSVIGVTGTNGKSTTVSMTSHLLDAMGYENALAGNIGTPPSEFLTRTHLPPPIMVLELSSYQLEQSQKIPSQVAAFLNLSPDHLARHGTMDQYLKEKWKLILMCPKNAYAFVDTNVAKMASKLEQPVCNLKVIDKNIAISQVPPEISGQHEWHNRLNGYYAAAIVAQYLNLSLSEVIPHLKSFRGLSHRFEKVGTIKGAKVINDSKATNIDSTMVALSNLDKPTMLLLGGQGKGESFITVKNYEHLIKKLVVFGHEGQKIKQELEDLNPIWYPDLKTTMQALPELFSVTDYGTDLLFSPGCASFDEFNNFEERGEFFKEQIQSLLDN